MSKKKDEEIKVENKPVQNFLKKVEDVAEITKRSIQIIIGILIVATILIQVCGLAQSDNLNVDSLIGETDNLLKTVGIGLIFSTAIELAYMLFTHGPDEALDPVITAIAAILLLRIPTPTPTSINAEIPYSRILELLVYGIIIAILFVIRELYLNGELKRKK